MRPEEFKDQPQSHFARLRIDPNYTIQHKEHYVSAPVPYLMTPEDIRNFNKTEVASYEKLFILKNGK